MNRPLIILALAAGACSPLATETAPPPAGGLPVDQQDATPTTSETSATTTIKADFEPFTHLDEPSCHNTTPENSEGPYYRPHTPERNSLIEDGMRGERLILIGYVLDGDCLPIPGAWLDFWQTDAAGEYDNQGYTLRGHQSTDGHGRYHLETILPGRYASRPIRHIHVKVQAPDQPVLTSQLYFPDQPVDGLTVQMESWDGILLARYDFVLGK